MYLFSKNESKIGKDVERDKKWLRNSCVVNIPVNINDKRIQLKMLFLYIEISIYCLLNVKTCLFTI